MFPGLRDIEKLLRDGEFEDGTRMSVVMKAVRRMLVSNVRETLTEGGFVQIRLRDGRVIQYTWDALLKAWQQVI